MLVRQLLSASGSSASKYFTAVFGGHSLSESVLFSAMNLFRLISSFHVASSVPIQFESAENNYILISFDLSMFF